MPDPEFYLVNSPGNYTKFPATLVKFTRNAQNPSITPDELQFTADLGTAIAPLAEIILVHEGMHLFHGYAVKRDDSNGNWKVTCKSVQWALDWRYIPEFIYHDVDLNTVLGSGAPSTTVGALFWINSLVLNGKWAAYSSTVAMLANADALLGATFYATTSYPNAGSIDGCDGVQLLAASAGIPSSANQYYQDGNALYVLFGDGSYLPNAFYVAAANRFDTRIRLGTVDIGTKKSNIDFSLAGQASRSLEDFFVKLGLEVQFRPRQDGYVYLDLATEIGRGSESAPVARYVDLENAFVLLGDAKEPAVQAVIGLNSDENPQPRTAMSLSRRDPQLFKIYDNTNLSLIDMQTMVDSLLDEADMPYTISTDIDYYLLPGDWIQIENAEIGIKVVRVRKVEIGAGKMVISAGKRLFSPAQAFGSYLKKTISSAAQPIRSVEIMDGSGTFTVYAADYAKGGLVVTYKESFSVPTDDTSVATGVFCDVAVNGAIAPPGRMKITDAAAVSVDITDACEKSASADKTNTILRKLYQATGWEATSGVVEQYLAQAFLDP